MSKLNHLSFTSPSTFNTFLNPNSSLTSLKCPVVSSKQLFSQQTSHNRTIKPRCAAATPPRRIGTVAKDLKDALQSSLTARTSRILLQLPPAARLGTETRKQNNPRTTNDDIIAGNRELARILTGLFDSTGLSVRLVFSNDNERTLANKMWGPSSTFDMDLCTPPSRKARRSSSKSASGFSNTNNSTNNTQDVHILVGGGTQMINYAVDLSKQFGQDKLIILANVNTVQDRISSDVQTYIDDTFTTVYYYKPDPHPTWQGGVLFRKYPNDWVLCRMTRVGILKTLLTTAEQPSTQQIGDILSKQKKEPSNPLFNALSSLIDSPES